MEHEPGGRDIDYKTRGARVREREAIESKLSELDVPFIRLILAANMIKESISVLVTVLLLIRGVVAQEPVDGPGHPFQDSLLEKLVGDWRVERKFGSGRTAENTLQAEWLLNHQFVELHYRDVATPPKYEAMVFIGYDNASERYVVHWIDIFGGRFSETLGYGKLDEAAHAIRFIFEYPDGPFVNAFTFDPKTKTWTSLMRQNEKGEWKTFAEDKFTRTDAKK
jgi:hypothetical protein